MFEATPSVVLSPVLFKVERKVTREMNESVDCDFTLSEIEAALSQMDTDMAPGPDGFNVSFYKEYWCIVGDETRMLFWISLILVCL